VTHLDVRAIADLLRREPMIPPRWLRSPHGQTLAAALWPRPVLESGEEWFVESEAGTRLRCVGDRVPGADTALVVVHGLGGSSDSALAVDVARSARRAGMHVVRMNMRNCGGTEHLTPTLYHSNLPQDLAAVVADAATRLDVGRIVVVGYSIGGNLVMNTLARWGASPPRQVAGAVVVCPAVDVAHCVDRLDGPGNEVYRTYFVRLLRQGYLRKAALFRGRFDATLMRGVRSVREYDRVATAPDAGLRDEDALYAWVSSASRIACVGVPTLVLQALDDPFVRMTPATKSAMVSNPMVSLVESAHGGHCGFVDSAMALGRRGAWIAERVARCALRACIAV
jgi:predicted alpha/beta-fold hydrolase